MTGKQRATLEFIERYYLSHNGMTPTRKEIAYYFGISINAVNCRLNYLKAQSRIRLIKYRWNNIRLTYPPALS